MYICMCARERRRKREYPFGKSGKDDAGVTWGEIRGGKGGKAKARTRRWHCAACIDVATLHKGGDDAEEGLNVGG